ncbi:MAG: hypothetical protein Tsb0015_11340 [Simkaniaceae bacterium]
MIEPSAFSSSHKTAESSLKTQGIFETSLPHYGQKKQCSTSSSDLLEKREKPFQPLIPYTPSRPSLSFPTPPLTGAEEKARSVHTLESFKQNLVRLVDGIETIKSEEISHFDDLITKVSDRMIESKQAEIEKMKENERKSQEIQSWSFLQNLATALLSAATIVIGGTLLATGVGATLVAGGFMVGSGVFSLIGLGLANAKVHPYITGTLALCSAAMGLAAGGISFFSYAHQLPNMLTAIMQGVTNIALGSTTIGRESSEYQKALLDKELSKVQKELALEQSQFDILTENLKKTSELLENQETANILRNYQTSIKQIISDNQSAV